MEQMNQMQIEKIQEFVQCAFFKKREINFCHWYLDTLVSISFRKSDSVLKDFIKEKIDLVLKNAK